MKVSRKTGLENSAYVEWNCIGDGILQIFTQAPEFHSCEKSQRFSGDSSPQHQNARLSFTITVRKIPFTMAGWISSPIESMELLMFLNWRACINISGIWLSAFRQISINRIIMHFLFDTLLFCLHFACDIYLQRGRWINSTFHFFPLFQITVCT